jgi:hypothetical protein
VGRAKDQQLGRVRIDPRRKGAAEKELDAEFSEESEAEETEAEEKEESDGEEQVKRRGRKRAKRDFDAEYVE